MDPKAWTIDEDRSLKFLRQEKNIQDWGIICQIMNESYLEVKRTQRQYKQRYYTHSRFFKENLQLTFTQQQLLIFMNLIMEKGCKWKQLSYYFPNKSEIILKNKFYNGIRRSTKLIKQSFKNSHQKSFNMTRTYLTKILELIEEVEKSQKIVYEKIDLVFGILELKKGILKLTFQPQKFSSEQILQLRSKVTNFNKKIYSYGIFKAKNLKTWKARESTLCCLLEASLKILGNIKYQQIQEQ